MIEETDHLSICLTDAWHLTRHCYPYTTDKENWVARGKPQTYGKSLMCFLTCSSFSISNSISTRLVVFQDCYIWHSSWNSLSQKIMYIWPNCLFFSHAMYTRIYIIYAEVDIKVGGYCKGKIWWYSINDGTNFQSMHVLKLQHLLNNALIWTAQAVALLPGSKSATKLCVTTTFHA